MTHHRHGLRRALGDVAKDVQTAMKEIQLPRWLQLQLRGGVQQLNNSFATSARR